MNERNRKRFEYGCLTFFVVALMAIACYVGYYEPPYHGKPITCLGWNQGWASEPELGGIAAAIELFRDRRRFGWPETIEQALLEAGDYFETKDACIREMPKEARRVKYPLSSGKCLLLPNGPPPLDREPDGTYEAIPKDLVLVRFIPHSDKDDILDFTWGGEIIRSAPNKP